MNIASPSIDACTVPQRHSFFLHRTYNAWRLKGLDAKQILNGWTAAPITPARISLALETAWAIAKSAGDADRLKSLMRDLRNQVMAGLIVRDLTGQADLDEVVTAVSALAEASVGLALTHATLTLQQTHGTPRDPNGLPQDLMVVGMGKLGGDELNVSSDIDLVYLYPSHGETDGARPLDNAEFFTRVARRITGMIGEVTADGFVFRVDTRLRPNGDSGPLVCSYTMFEEYLIVQGREWERYAWLKGRVVSPPVLMTGSLHRQAIDDLDVLIRPFVYRRYLDFGAIGALRSLHAQIRAEANRRDVRAQRRSIGSADPFDVKLGRGGIREVEFIAQLFQLVRGGREPALRLRQTRKALSALAETGRLPKRDETVLQDAYRFLRNLEHRLQYREDAQTQRLPTDPDTLLAIAETMGCASIDQFLEVLTDTTEHVAGIFDRIFGEKSESEPSNAPLYEGFTDPQGAESRIQSALQSTRVVALPQAHRERFDRLIPRALMECAKHGKHANTALNRLMNFLESIARRGAYLSLLEEYPAAMSRVVEMIARSGWTADYLERHPLVLDELLDDRELSRPPEWPKVRQILEAEMAQARLANGGPDVERQIDLLREHHHAAVFRLLAQDLAGQWAVESLADHVSALADMVLDVALQACWKALPKTHREQPLFAIIAYGKLGAKELGFASDLDLVFLHDDPHPDANEVYTRFVRRFVNWLTALTPAGNLFEIDLRLRPDGDAGATVVTYERFVKYQHHHAWLWEHQALTRARYCAGDQTLGQRFEMERRRILALPRNHEHLAHEIQSMRQRVTDGHPNTTELFDLKHDRGGMVDLEFAVQFIVLRHGHSHPELLDNVGNIALLKRAAEAKLIPGDLALNAGNAYRELRRNQHQLRLEGARFARLEPGILAEHRDAVIRLWERLFTPVEPKTSTTPGN